MKNITIQICNNITINKITFFKRDIIYTVNSSFTSTYHINDKVTSFQFYSDVGLTWNNSHTKTSNRTFKMLISVHFSWYNWKFCMTVGSSIIHGCHVKHYHCQSNLWMVMNSSFNVNIYGCVKDTCVTLFDHWTGGLSDAPHLTWAKTPRAFVAFSKYSSYKTQHIKQ